jgi:hypothetical protein
MIAILLLVPIIGSLIILPIQETSNKNKVIMKNIALITSIFNFLISIFMWLQFDSSTTQYQFVFEFNQLSFCHFNVGIDSISLFFVLITTFITPVALLSNFTNINKNIKFFLIAFLILETLQIALFVVLDLMLFYIFFESVLPILYIVIVLYGSGENRFRSANLLFLYTLAGSLPMLLSILVIYNNVGSTDFTLISLNEISLESQKILWLSFPLSKVNLTSKGLNRIIKSRKLTTPSECGPFTVGAQQLKRLKWLAVNNKCKSLVVYGSNISYTVNYPYFYNDIVRHMVRLPINLNSVLLGIILSDGYLKKR